MIHKCINKIMKRYVKSITKFKLIVYSKEKQIDNVYDVITNEYFVKLIDTIKNLNPRKDVFVHIFQERSYLYNSK